MNTKFLTKASIIAALYVVLTLALGEFSYGPIQFRISESLVLLPLIEPAAVLGVFIGCLLANTLIGFGPWDIVLGSLLTLTAAYLTSKAPTKYLGIIPPVVLNALGVPIILIAFLGLESLPYGYWGLVLSIGISQLLVLTILGLPVLHIYEKFIKNKKLL